MYFQTAKRPGANLSTEAYYYLTHGRTFDDFQQWAFSKGAVGFQRKVLANKEVRYIAIHNTYGNGVRRH